MANSNKPQEKPVKEPVKEPVKAYVTKYTIKELSEAAETAFGTQKVIVQAALKSAGKESYSMEEATRIVTAFKNKEVSK